MQSITGTICHQRRLTSRTLQVFTEASCVHKTNSKSVEAVRAWWLHKIPVYLYAGIGIKNCRLIVYVINKYCDYHYPYIISIFNIVSLWTMSHLGVIPTRGKPVLQENPPSMVSYVQLWLLIEQWVAHRGFEPTPVIYRAFMHAGEVITTVLSTTLTTGLSSFDFA